MFKSHHSKDLALFEIKLKSPHKDLILIKGNEYECEPIPFEGSIKLSTLEDIHAKRIKLSLIGEYAVDFFERDSSRTIVDQIYERLCVLKVDWPNLLVTPNGDIKFGNYGEQFLKMNKLDSLNKKSSSSNNGSSTSLNKKGSPTPTHSNNGSSSDLSSMADSVDRPLFARTKSQPILSKQMTSSLIKLPKSGIDGTPFLNQPVSSHHSYLLPKGNYNIPFRIYLPASTPETVEGLNPGKLLYRLECTIERGRFEKALHKTKHIRIVRTLHPQNLNMIESIDINNTWPGKVQYNVSLPKKGIALGSTVPVHVLIVPIAKGLKLRAINAVIVQHYYASHTQGRSPEFEELFGKQHLPISDREKAAVDQWSIKTQFVVPDNLKQITQTCDLKNSMVQVKHRLRISIQLKNKEGHVSELRANLPIFVYISAHVGHTVGRHFEFDHHQNTLVPHADMEDCLFKKDKQDNPGIRSKPQSPTLAAVDEGDLSQLDIGDEDAESGDEESAPPLYQKHIFDKIYDINLPQTPLEQFRSQSVQNSPLHSPAGSMANISDYFDIPRNIDSYLELAAGTPIGSKRASPLYSPSPNLDLSTLLKVPSYLQAVDEDDSDGAEDLAPSYEGDGTPPLSRSPTNLTSPLPKEKSHHHHLHHAHLSFPKRMHTHSPLKSGASSASSSATDLTALKSSTRSKSHLDFSKALHKKK